ncbi:Gamma-soluble NSF attachment [Paramuricea clavata]|uniref:Gamma-soluble NSF attachment protein n=1 Tax=Paramuricea clavata TaxID=317549 RepID=A0A6S7IKM2_PARCT|nr:Gamma-soluble NSF attachment [Paramuricea clavata]
MANSLSEKKIREGLLLLKEADKCLQTSWLKWKPDYDNAADKFMKAGTAFKVGKSYNQAKDAFLKAADAHAKNHSLFHSGKALEQAGAMLKEMKKLDEAAELMQRAGSLYQEHGTPDTAALVLIKAAKMCEGTNTKKAIELYQSAGELREMDDKLREAAEPYAKVTQLFIKLQKFEDVVKSLLKQLELYARIGNTAMQYKVILGLTVVHLAQSDYVAADKCFKDAFEVGGFGTSDEAEAIEELLQAYDQSDADQIKTIVTKPLFRNLDNELSKLARDLKPSDEFNISEQHTELRLLSSDIARLNVDETKAAGDKKHKTSEPPPRQRLEFDEDEENPLGSDENAGGLETAQGSETLNEKPNEVPTTHDEVGTTYDDVSTTHDEVSTTHDEVGTTSDEHSPSYVGVENNGESESKENVTEEGPGDEDDDFEGGLC